MEKKIEFLYLSEEDMVDSGVLEAERCVEVMEEVNILLSKGDYLMGGRDNNEHGIEVIFPKKSKIKEFPIADTRDRRFMAMPAYLGGRFHLTGEKWYGSNGGNNEKGLPRSILLMILNDVETGKPLAIMSANLLSAMRTGAMSGIIAKHLAKKNSKVIALVGAGAINKACIVSILPYFKDIEKIKIKGSSITSKTAKDLSEFICKNYSWIKSVEVCSTLQESVEDADIISEAVSAKQGEWPVFDSNWLKPGCILISSGTMEIDRNFICNRMTKVVDNIHMYENYITTYEHYDEKTGKRISTGTPGMFFVDMIQDGKITKDDVRSLGDIIRGVIPGRMSEDEMFLISSGGMPILDIAWGYECYQKALLLGKGTKLNLWNEPHLF
ncbi:tyramine oxidase subunit B [Clostridium tyrobutyricum]|uniref:tyramine oxidase subunit B n=1 Tax=Clostridium tyrobutyricum TaxID=1519 RepID=UPI001C3859B9|nr:tyramine oxidase subunit B [Clostridium tyrobutyricum]MBV4439311.1 ornithine cyclodeaminase [Clostridium tyrobutyricum]